MSNHITIIGNVQGSEPELKYTSGGMAILTFSVVDNHGKDEKKKTMWHNVTVFSKLAENVANTVTKGSTVIISGRYEQDEFTKKDGTKGKSIKLIADEVGVSCRWNSWVADQTEATMKQIGQVFPTASQVSEDEFF
jgi:single-strand DNA-binding protein